MEKIISPPPPQFPASQQQATNNRSGRSVAPQVFYQRFYISPHIYDASTGNLVTPKNWLPSLYKQLLL